MFVCVRRCESDNVVPSGDAAKLLQKKLMCGTIFFTVGQNPK